MKKMVITGAGGFIGRVLTNFFRQDKNYFVVPVTRKELNLLDGDAVMAFFKEENADIVIHCANQGGSRKVNGLNKNDVIENNLKMFFNIERSINEQTKFINFGSGAQYDKGRDLIKVKEEDFDRFIPKDDYGYSKYVMSKYIKMSKSSHNKNIYNPIIFGLYGVGEDYTYRFISNAIIKNILKMPIVINQDVVFDYLYITDFLRILVKMIEEEWEEKEVNVTPTESISLREIAGYINEVGRYQSEIQIINKGMNYEYTGDNSLLLSRIGTDFKFTPYKTAIEQLYQYYSENRDRLDLAAIQKDELIGYCKTKKDVGEKNDR